MSTTLVDVPPAVARASRLYIIGAVLDLVNLVVTLVMLPAVLAAANAQLGDVGGATAVAAVGAGWGILSGIAFSVLTIFFARRLLARRNWARILLLVLTLLAVPGVLLPQSSAGLPVALVVLSAVLSIVSLLVALAAAVLTFLPDSNAWFRKAAPATV